MATAKRLPAEIRDHIGALHVALQEFIDSQNEAYDERSEKWQDSDAGSYFSDWLADLQNLCDDLEGCPLEPQS